MAPEKPAAYADLGDMSEDARIAVIGQMVMTQRKTVAFVVDAVPPAKVRRYIRKLTGRFPGIRILEQLAGPTPGAVLVKVAPPDLTPKTDCDRCGGMMIHERLKGYRCPRCD